MQEFRLESRKKCALCHDENSTTFIPFCDIPVVKCSKCGFMYSSKIFQHEAMASYYANDFGSDRHRRGQAVNAKVNSMVLSRMLDFKHVGNVLDVGSGYGFLLRELGGRRGIDATGVELSKQEASYARDQLGLNVINKPLSESGLKPASFDLVTTFEVIEHVPNPPEFIQALAAYVKPGGHLVVMTDNFESRVAQSLGPGFPKWIPHSHISHLSTMTMRNMINGVSSLRIVAERSYTPLELLARNAISTMRKTDISPSSAFDLHQALSVEMQGSYRLYGLRRLINPVWARLSLRKSMDGALIYFAMEKRLR